VPCATEAIDGAQTLQQTLSSNSSSMINTTSGGPGPHLVVPQLVPQHALHLQRRQQLQQRGVHHHKRPPPGDRQRVCVRCRALRCQYQADTCSTCLFGRLLRPTADCSLCEEALKHYQATRLWVAASLRQCMPYLPDVQLGWLDAQDVCCLLHAPVQAGQLRAR
jgi:hypothetical protein